MANIFDFNQVGKNTIDKNKKYERQAGEYLAQYNQQLKEEADAKAASKENSALSAARFAYASTYARSKNRINSLQESITYENTASITGMTEMVSEVVENALLLDEEEFAQLNPEYKEEIRDRVRGFLENAEINKNIKNRDTLALMEYVYKNLPDVKTGKYLTEDDISRLMKMQKPVEIEESIKNLSGDVSSRVAELVESEQKRIKDTNKKLEDAKVETNEEVAQEPVETPVEEDDTVVETPEGEIAVEPVVKKQIQMLPDGTININMLENEETLTEDHITKRLGFGFTKNQKYDDEMMIGKATGDIKSNLGPLILSLIPYVGLPAGIVATIRAIKNSEAINSSKMETLKKLVYEDKRCKNVLDEIHKELLKNKPDGKKLRVYRNEFQDEVRRVKREAAGEQLTEEFDAIINYKEPDRSFVRETPRTGLLETLAVNEAMNLLSEGKEYNSDLCLANALMYITITEAMDTLGLMNVDSNVYSNIISAAGGNVISEASSSAKRAFKNGGADYIKYEAGRELGKKIAKERAEKPYETKDSVDKKMERMAKAGVKDSDDLRKTTALQESCITQWKQPVNNTGYSDLAERIRQRRLAKLTETEKTDSSNPTLLD